MQCLHPAEIRMTIFIRITSSLMKIDPDPLIRIDVRHRKIIEDGRIRRMDPMDGCAERGMCVEFKNKQI